MPSSRLAATPRFISPDLLKALAILFAGVVVFSPALSGNWYGDDALYITRNPQLYDPAHLWKIWFAPGSFIEYYPIGQTVQWMQWQLWGTDSPYPYLVCNLVLHLTSALLLWQLFRKLGLRLAWLGGLIFAIHPLMVDSVGVSSELKNTLSLPPFLLAMIFYLDFEATRNVRSYVCALLLFLAAMLCKITMCFFPVVLLLYAWWKRGRIARPDVIAALPFFLISLVLGLTFLHSGQVYAADKTYVSPGPIHLGGGPERLALAGLSLVFYFGHSFLPVHPVPYYPLWSLDPLTPWHYLPWLVLAIAPLACWVRRDSWGRPALFGLGFFTLALAPFLGLNEVSYMCLAWVHDHFLYIPIIALIGLTLAGLEGVASQLPANAMGAARALLIALLFLLGFQTWSYSQRFADQQALWADNLRTNPNSWMLHHLEASELDRHGDHAGALAEERESVRINPAFDNAQYSLGADLLTIGDYPAAIDAFRACLTANPHYDGARLMLGITLTKAGRTAEAVDLLAAFVQAHPNVLDGHLALSQALAQAGRQPEAIAEMETVVRLSPNDLQLQAMLKQLQQTAPTKK